MERKIIFYDKEYEYKLYYKNIKSLYIRFVNGEIIVSVPYGTEMSVIESFLQINKDKLITRIEGYVEYIGEDYIYIYGKKYSLEVIDSDENKCELKEGCLYVYSRNYKVCLERFLLEKLYLYLVERVEYFIPYYGLKRPSVNIRYYKSKWGCCYVYQDKVVYNSKLIHLDKKVIDYVVVHELCHFLEKGHNKRFYSLVEECIPDYKECIGRLKESHT